MLALSLVLTVIAVAGIAGTIALAVRDGYRRAPRRS
jgi:hypothetical protein